MAAKDGTYFVNARAGKARQTGNPYAFVEVVVVKDGQANHSSMFTSSAVVESARGIPALSPVSCSFDQEMGTRGPRLVLSGISPA